MIPLDSPRWKELRHAYGSAADTPGLLREIRGEPIPHYKDGGAWFEVYSSLYHQHSTASATYAAFPHLVDIGETGTLEQRVAVLCLAGNIRVHGNPLIPGEEIPQDLLPEFEAAMLKVKETSLATIRAAVKASALDECTVVGDLLQAFGGLRNPSSGYVVQLDYLVSEGWNVEARCPSCTEFMLAELREEIITSMIKAGAPVPKSAKRASVDRSGYPAAIAEGQAILATGAIDWPKEAMPSVLAGLAAELGEPKLAQCILDLGASVVCPYCEHRLKLSTGLDAI